LELAPGASLVGEGFPARVPVVPYDKQKKVFQVGHTMLQDLIDADIGEEVTFEHDEELDKFPEVVEALNAATGEAVCFCIAKCAKLSKWAVGTAYGWKSRETAAKLALAIAIAHDGGQIETLSQSEGDFGAFCMQAGLIQQDMLPEGAKGTGALQYPVLGLALNGASVLTDEKNMTGTAPAVYYDAEWQDCFAIAQHMLWDLIGDGTKRVEYTHDTEMDQFPEIKQAIADAGGEEDCYCVAICAECNTWAVGIASGWKNREKAAKVALALALADEQKTFEKCVNKYREFALLCQSAELITADRVPGKRKKWGSGGGWGESSGGWEGGYGKGGYGGGWEGGYDPLQAVMELFKGALKGGGGYGKGGGKGW